MNFVLLCLKELLRIIKTETNVIIITQNQTVRSTAILNKIIHWLNTTTTFLFINIITVIAIATNTIAPTTFTSITTIIFAIFITSSLIFDITTIVTETKYLNIYNYSSYPSPA